ncbi:MAG: S8 family serine peptidase [Calditrichia bacterium]
MNKFYHYVLSAVLLLVGISAGAARISERLDLALQAAKGDNTPVRCLVVLRDQVDIVKMDREMYASRVSPQERAYRVITSLQEKAGATQSVLLSFLENKASAEVLSVQPLWIVNMLVVEALPSVIIQLSGRPDVEFLDLDAQLEWDQPEDEHPARSRTNSSEIGLRVINAHKLWEMGYSGAGRLVMGLDTGVDGNHPALSSRWRGNQPGIPASAAWFDPDGSSFPFDNNSHGTHTVGTMCGLDTVNHDTIGVAFGAQWIAARTIGPSGNFTSMNISAYQWAMDPDGNPSTNADMPDAIGCSWQDPSAGDCNPTYQSAFNAVEAAGIAICFSAGNQGGAPNSSTITVPKNINTTLVNSWATGGIDGNSPNLTGYSSSSKGPSRCGGVGSLLIKPEACAPAVSVRSSTPGGQYGTKTGTSMACPHVVGSIALLKEAFPTRTGHEIKMALYLTARESPSDPYPGEDNTFGMGIIDIFEAFNYLGIPNPPESLTAYSDYTMPNAMLLNWINPTNFSNGDTLLPSDYQIFIERDSLLIDSLPGGTSQYLDTGLNDGQLYEYSVFVKADSLQRSSQSVQTAWIAGGSPVPQPPSEAGISLLENELHLRWRNPALNIDGTPMDDLAGLFLYQDGMLVAVLTRTSADSGRLDSTVIMNPPVGFHIYHLRAFDNESPQNVSLLSPGLITPLNAPVGDGFYLPGAPNGLIWNNRFADVNARAVQPPSPPYALNLNGKPAGGDTLELYPVDLSMMQGSSIVFAYYYQPQGQGNAPETGDSLTVTFRNSEDEWIIVRQYPGSPLQPFQQEIIDVENAPAGSGTFMHSQFQARFTNIGSPSVTSPNDDWFVDNIVLGLQSARIAISQDSLVFPDTEVGDTARVSFAIQNLGLDTLHIFQIFSTEPAFLTDTSNLKLSAGSVSLVEVAFIPTGIGAFSGMINLVSSDTSRDTLSIPADGLGIPPVGIAQESTAPRRFALSANYPNPFNPSTTINFQIPESGQVYLQIFNMLGQRVRTLVSNHLEPGSYQVVWDGLGDNGQPAASGIYLYRLQAGAFQKEMKMILMK